MSSNDKKSLRISARPERRQQPATPDAFVTGKEPLKRLTVDMPESLHRRAIVGAARDGVKLAAVIREFLEGRFPA